MYPKHKSIRLTVTTTDGEVLDTFSVSHWRTETNTDIDDEESIGSIASEDLLVERIKRYVEDVPKPKGGVN